MTKIKFCGLRREEDVKMAASLGAGFMGFILSERFKRFISPEETARLKQFASSAKTVGVFVDEPADYVVSASKTAKLDMIQLHGSEDDDYISEIKEKTGLPVIKMIKPVSEDDIIAARSCKADLILLDSGAGGTGRTFDWSLAEDLGRDYILAGGLTPDNVGDAVERLKPFAVDVSSGVETEGIKDFSKKKAFAAEVKRYDKP